MAVPILTSLIFWTFLAAIIIGPIYFRHRDRVQMHETLRSAFEKGVALPPELITSLQGNLAAKTMPTREGDLRRGIVLVGVGIGVAILGYGLWYGLASVDDTAAAITGACTAGAGAIPGLIGVAYLILWATKSKSTPKSIGDS
jgi:hypothetical protein